ncbi:MAG: hypothetical protein NXI04_20780 [Planctomycetaceae bacterium]|nr:hypothetical protein [Planctomycetaceae bacterium]
MKCEFSDGRRNDQSCMDVAMAVPCVSSGCPAVDRVLHIDPSGNPRGE